VHHHTYANVGDELMWQLVAVCRECHQKFHDKNGVPA
jgi:5-methylcytosine-specific restriction endonuclease McrA